MIEAITLMTVLAIALAGVLVVNLFTGGHEKEKVPCKTHSWVLDQNEKMICMECGYRPEANQ